MSKVNSLLVEQQYNNEIDRAFIGWVSDSYGISEQGSNVIDEYFNNGRSNSKFDLSLLNDASVLDH